MLRSMSTSVDQTGEVHDLYSVEDALVSYGRLIEVAEVDEEVDEISIDGVSD